MAYDYKNGVELAKVYKSKSAFIAFTKITDGSKTAIDVREKFDRIDGSTQHTTKGFVIPVEKFDDFMVAARDVFEELRPQQCSSSYRL